MAAGRAERKSPVKNASVRLRRERFPAHGGSAAGRVLHAPRPRALPSSGRPCSRDVQTILTRLKGEISPNGAAEDSPSIFLKRKPGVGACRREKHKPIGRISRISRIGRGGDYDRGIGSGRVRTFGAACDQPGDTPDVGGGSADCQRRSQGKTFAGCLTYGRLKRGNSSCAGNRSHSEERHPCVAPNKKHKPTILAVMSTAKPHGMTESGGSPGNAVQPEAKRRARNLKRRQRRIWGGVAGCAIFAVNGKTGGVSFWASGGRQKGRTTFFFYP